MITNYDYSGVIDNIWRTLIIPFKKTKTCKTTSIKFLKIFMKKIILGLILLINSTAHALTLEDSLIEAVKNNDYPSVIKCLDSGANPDGKISDHYAISPLGLACNQGNIDIVSLLLKRRANPNYKPNNNSSPFFYATAGREKNEIMSLLIKYGLDINLSEAGQDHHAFFVITLGHIKTLKTLLDAGLNSKIKNKDGYTLAEWAKKVGRKDCYDLITNSNKPIESEEVILINHDKLLYNLSHRINDNSQNPIYLNESIFLPKKTVIVYAHASYYSAERYVVGFDTNYFSGAFLIELDKGESLNITYGNYINQDLRLCFIGYGLYTDNDVEVQTYRFTLDNRKITKNTLLERP